MINLITEYLRTYGRMYVQFSYVHKNIMGNIMKDYVLCMGFVLLCCVLNQNPNHNNHWNNTYLLWKHYDDIDLTLQELSYNLLNFPARFSPRAAGRRGQARRLRRLPVGGPPLGEFFLQN